MEFNYYEKRTTMVNENMVTDIIKNVINKADTMKNTLKNNFNKFITLLVDKGIDKEFLNIINKQFKTNYKTIGQLQSLKESSYLNEDWKNFLRFFKGETYPALSIFPTLQIWFEIDKLLNNVGITDLNWKKIAIYGTLWVIIVTGQHAILWNKWRKEHPEEYEKEGKPGIFKSGKK